MRPWETDRWETENRETENRVSGSRESGPGPGSQVPVEAVAGEPIVQLALRLRRQVDQQARTVERSAAVLTPGELAELRRGLARLGRCGQHLLALGAAPPGDGPLREVAAVLLAAAGPTSRVSLGPAPLAALDPPADDDLENLVAELVDHVFDTAPSGSRVSVRGRWTEEGGITVEIRGEPVHAGVPITDRDEAALLVLAAQLGRRCALGVTVTSPSTYVVHCPPMHLRAGSDTTARAAELPHPGLPQLSAPGTAHPEADELFGPLTGALDLGDVHATPIFAAVASAWFREDNTGPDWASPGDAEWAAAAARRAKHAVAEADLTAAGLPRRRPGTEMVTPALRTGTAQAPAPADREPERVRSRLAVYQQGLRRGRHRADDEAPVNGRAAGDGHDPWLL